MRHQIELRREARADERVLEGVHEVAPDIAYQRLAIVNVVYCGVRARAIGAGCSSTRA